MLSKFSNKSLQSTLTILLSMILSACVASTTPAVPIPTITTVQPTSTQTSTPTQPLLQMIKPSIIGRRLRFDSWSPDSKWFTYWVADRDNAPAHLAFAEVQLGKICEQQEVSVVDLNNGDVTWLKDGTVSIADYSSQKAFHGVPCGTFSQVEFIPSSNNENFLSPDNRYRAITVVNGHEAELTHNVTTINSLSTNQVVATVKWDSGPHTWAESGWLTNKLYLVGLDVIKQQVLYVSIPDGKIGNVITDLMGLKMQNVGFIVHMGRYTSIESGTYHLLVERAKASPLPLLLFHSEMNRTEQLPFYEALLNNGIIFSPDGKWLFLSQPSSASINQPSDFWFRPVDPPDGAASKLADSMNFAGFSTEVHKIVFTNDYVYILNFPSGEIVSQLGVPSYHVDRIWWSLDGTRLAMQGFSQNSEPEALFVVEP